MFKMPFNLEEGHFNISSFFWVFWSERGSALEYGEDFARNIYLFLFFDRPQSWSSFGILCRASPCFSPI